MSCRSYRIRFYAQQRTPLPAAERDKVRAHFQECPECSAFLKEACSITCRQMVAFLDDYLDGVLAEGEKRVFETHLAVCPDCVDYLATYRTTIRAANSLARAESASPPPAIPDDLVTGILLARGLGASPPAG